MSTNISRWAKVIAGDLRLEPREVMKWINHVSMEELELSRVWLRLRYNEIKHEQLHSTILSLQNIQE